LLKINVCLFVFVCILFLIHGNFKDGKLIVSTCQSGRDGAQRPLPQPFLAMDVSENSIVWWSPKGLVFGFAFCVVDVLFVELVVLAFKEPMREAKKLQVEEPQETKLPQSEPEVVDPAVPVVAAAPLDASSDATGVVAPPDVVAPVASVSAPPSAPPVVPAASDVVPEVVAVPLCFAGRDDSKTGFVFERSSENVGGKLSTVLHISSCLIHKVAWFETLFVVACNGNQVVVWDCDEHSGNYAEVGVFELSGFDLEKDLIVALTVFRDQAVLLPHHNHAEMSVIKVEGKEIHVAALKYCQKVLVLSSRNHAWLLELHRGTCHVRQLSPKKEEVLSEEQTEPLLCVVCDANGRSVKELSASLEEASSRFLVCCWRNRVSVRRFGKHLALEEMSVFRLPADTRIESATLFSETGSGFLGLVTVLESCADVLLMPALDVAKGPFCKLNLFDIDR
jgi:hypothetical protein